MPWFHHSHRFREHDRLPRGRREEPFTPRVPQVVLSRLTLAGAGMAAAGVAGNWVIVNRMAGWPAWTLFPSMIVAVLSLTAMVIGLGILVVRALEPILGLMDLNWDAEPIAVLGIPVHLQRKCERLGFWTAESVVKAIDRGHFPWTALEYDERMQIARAAERWGAAVGVAVPVAGPEHRRQGW